MIVQYKNFLWCIIIYFRFNSSLSQPKKIKNLLNDESITRNLTKNNSNNGNINEIKNFLFYKSNVIYERSCTCEMEMSCSCCESVVLLFTKSLGQLCGNLIYRPQGFNVNITLDKNTIRSMTVTNYRPFKICALIPKSLFSIICLNILELNLFPRSITACPRLEIATKNQNWKINYTCVSISTEMESEIDSLIGNNSNRLTNNEAINPLTILQNQTALMQNTSALKQTQPQLSVMIPGTTNLSNTNKNLIEMTPETFKASLISPMINFMQSSGLPVSLVISTSTLNTPLPMIFGTSRASSVMTSSRSSPYATTTKMTCKKSSEFTETQTHFRNYPTTTTTLTNVNSQKLTPHFINTISTSFLNLPNQTTTMLAITEKSSVTFNTSEPLNYSSLITEDVQETSEINKKIDSTSINSTNTSTIDTSPMDTHKIVETLNKTLTPIISIIPIIFPDNYSDAFFNKLNSNNTHDISTTPNPSSSSIELMEDKKTETILEIMLTTQTIINNTDDHADQTIVLNSSKESLKNTTTSQDI